MDNVKEKINSINIKRAIKATTLLLGLILIIFISFFNATFDFANFKWGEWLANSSVLVGIMIFCEGYSPQRLEISQSKITVLRRYDSITIPRSMILSVVQLEPKDMKRVYTDGGCAGLFGYFGGFRSKQLGRFKMYATSMDNLYLITLSDGRKIVIGCTEPKLLL